MADISKTFPCPATAKSVINKLIDAGVSFSAKNPDGSNWTISVKGEHVKMLSLSRLESVASTINSMVGRSPLNN